MTVSLLDACIAWDHRKTEVDPVGELGAAFSRKQAVLLFQEFDIDPGEALALMSTTVRVCALGLLTGQADLGELLGGIWFDALMTGMLLEKLRAAEAQA